MSRPFMQNKETDLEWTAVVSKNARIKLNRKTSSKNQKEDNVQNKSKQRKRTQNGTSGRTIHEKQQVKENIRRRQNLGETRPSQRENLQNSYRHSDQRNIYNDPRQNYVNAWPQLGVNFSSHQYNHNLQRNWNIGINQGMDNQLPPRQDTNSEINEFPPLGQHVWVNTPYNVPVQNINNVQGISNQNQTYPFSTQGIHQSQNRKTMNVPEANKDIMHASNVNARSSKSKPQQKKNNQHKRKNDKKNLQIKSKEKLISSPKSSSQLDPHAAAFIHFDNMLPMGTTVKGKQKTGKRKKMLTPLKKQILKERLKQWKISQGINDDASVGEKKTECTYLSSITFLKGYVQYDELEDDDEYNEIIQDFRVLAEKVGNIDDVFIPRYFQNDMQVDECLAFVKFVDRGDALAAKACWNGMVLGGIPIIAEVIPADFLSKRTSSDMNWTDGLKDVSYADLMFSAESDSRRDKSTPGTVVLGNVLTEDDLEDNECLEETLNDIKALASDFGPLQSEGESSSVNEITNEIFLHFQKLSDANSAVSKLNGSMFGGAICEAKTISDGLGKNSVTSKIFLENILSEDDYEDEECLEATIEDIRGLVKEFGTVENIEVHLEGTQKGRVDIYFDSLSSAEAAVAKLNGLVIGGLMVNAALDMAERDLIPDSMVILENFLSEDDYDDEDCLEETKNDLKSIMDKFGKIKSMDVHVEGEQEGQIHVEYDDPDAAQKASKTLHNSTFGGKKVSVLIQSREGKNVSLSTPEENNDANLTPAPLYSGNKVIPEQYAECKRVPKVPNAGVPREYAKRIDDENVIPLLFEMLGELMRLQLRAKENKNAKARRRLVMGLREVARGIRAKKVKMVVLANNLDEYGALDSKLEAILKLANDNGIPVIFDLNKRKIGKALGKTIKVSVVGIENADGAYDSFKKLKRHVDVVETNYFCIHK